MKRLLSILVFLMIIAPANAESDFSDVPDIHRYVAAVEYLYYEGIVDGYPDGSFQPDITINRAEFTKIVLGAVESVDTEDTSIGGIDLSDLEDGEWYVPYIRGAIERGMIEGYPDGTFRPADEVNFVEAAKIITMAFDFEPEEDDVWYKPYVEALGDIGAIPVSINDFDQKITRGEMSEIIYRLLADITDETTQTYRILNADENDIEALQEKWCHFSFNHINEVRFEHGVGPLILNETLNDFAMYHSKDMAMNIGELSHEGSLDETADDRIRYGQLVDPETDEFVYKDPPYYVEWSGENIGNRTVAYYGSVENAIMDIHAYFIDEPEDEFNHRTTMLSTLVDFTQVGVGIYVDENNKLWLTEDYISTWQ